MSIQVEFEAKNAETEQLDGTTVASEQQFLLLFQFLGMAIAFLEQSDDDEHVDAFAACARFIKDNAFSDDLFIDYTTALRRALSQAGDPDLSEASDPDNIHPVARTLVQALLLRPDPLTAQQAEQALSFFPFIQGFARAIGMATAPDEYLEQFDRVSGAIVRCLEVCVATGAGYKTDF